ncbi:hypothetical protein M6B38_114045 [Iris pallida]|uniref:Uncharacterized protein n=1 Tax=Iris pallida TaxID=29817 RepID=A0AAX6IKZ0_IRIPA|nr:hypothetical protein M6B38_114045 [Iris pallida]
MNFYGNAGDKELVDTSKNEEDPEGGMSVLGDTTVLGNRDKEAGNQMSNGNMELVIELVGAKKLIMASLALVMGRAGEYGMCAGWLISTL